MTEGTREPMPQGFLVFLRTWAGGLPAGSTPVFRELCVAARTEEDGIRAVNARLVVDGEARGLLLPSHVS